MKLKRVRLNPGWINPSTVQISVPSFVSRPTVFAFAPFSTFSTRLEESFQRKPNGGGISSANAAGRNRKTTRAADKRRLLLTTTQIIDFVVPDKWTQVTPHRLKMPGILPVTLESGAIAEGNDHGKIEAAIDPGRKLRHIPAVSHSTHTRDHAAANGGSDELGAIGLALRMFQPKQYHLGNGGRWWRRRARSRPGRSSSATRRLLRSSCEYFLETVSFPSSGSRISSKLARLANVFGAVGKAARPCSNRSQIGLRADFP